MSWQETGQWLKDHSGDALGLVGAIMAGNAPAAIALGASLVSEATGSIHPSDALDILATNPDARARLAELASKNEDAIRRHHRKLIELELEDQQASHKQTQETIRNGDNAEDMFVKRTRPAQSWVSLAAAITYVFMMETPDELVLGLLLTLPFTYAGLRQIGHGIEQFKRRQ